MRELFLEHLMKNLLLAKAKFPEKYAWEKTDIINVFRNFAEGLQDGTYSRQCHAIKWTCRDLKLACTRDAIDEIFNETETKGQEHGPQT